METGGTPTVFPFTAKDTVLAAPDDLGIESFTLWALREKGLRMWRPHVPFGPRVQGESRWNKGFPSQVRLMRHLLATVASYPCLLAQSEEGSCNEPKGRQQELGKSDSQHADP